MELTTEQITFIREDIKKKGITMAGLLDSLVDHICCVIEADTETDFYTAYHKAIETFGQEGLKEIQQNTILLLTLKKEMIMKRSMYLLGYIAVFLCCTAFLFKMQQWPGASVMLVLGIAILNLGFLPVYFYSRYKRSVV